MVWWPFATQPERADTSKVTDLHSGAPPLYSVISSQLRVRPSLRSPRLGVSVVKSVRLTVRSPLAQTVLPHTPDQQLDPVLPEEGLTVKDHRRHTPVTGGF